MQILTLNEVKEKMDTKARAKKFVSEIGLPIVRFARDVNLSPDTIRKWFRGDMRLRDNHVKRIDAFLRKYNQ